MHESQNGRDRLIATMTANAYQACTNTTIPDQQKAEPRGHIPQPSRVSIRPMLGPFTARLKRDHPVSETRLVSFTPFSLLLGDERPSSRSCLSPCIPLYHSHVPSPLWHTFLLWPGGRYRMGSREDDTRRHSTGGNALIKTVRAL